MMVLVADLTFDNFLLRFQATVNLSPAAEDSIQTLTVYNVNASSDFIADLRQ